MSMSVPKFHINKDWYKPLERSSVPNDDVLGACDRESARAAESWVLANDPYRKTKGKIK